MIYFLNLHIIQKSLDQNFNAISLIHPCKFTDTKSLQIKQKHIFAKKEKSLKNLIKMNFSLFSNIHPLRLAFQALYRVFHIFNIKTTFIDWKPESLSKKGNLQFK